MNLAPKILTGISVDSTGYLLTGASLASLRTVFDGTSFLGATVFMVGTPAQPYSSVSGYVGTTSTGTLTISPAWTPYLSGITILVFPRRYIGWQRGPGISIAGSITGGGTPLEEVSGRLEGGGTLLLTRTTHRPFDLTDVGAIILSASGPFVVSGGYSADGQPSGLYPTIIGVESNPSGQTLVRFWPWLGLGLGFSMTISPNVVHRGGPSCTLDYPGLPTDPLHTDPAYTAFGCFAYKGASFGCSSTNRRYPGSSPSTYGAPFGPYDGPQSMPVTANIQSGTVMTPSSGSYRGVMSKSWLWSGTVTISYPYFLGSKPSAVQASEPGLARPDDWEGEPDAQGVASRLGGGKAQGGRTYEVIGPAGDSAPEFTIALNDQGIGDAFDGYPADLALLSGDSAGEVGPPPSIPGDRPARDALTEASQDTPAFVGDIYVIEPRLDGVLGYGRAYFQGQYEDCWDLTALTADLGVTPLIDAMLGGWEVAVGIPNTLRVERFLHEAGAPHGDLALEWPLPGRFIGSPAPAGVVNQLQHYHWLDDLFLLGDLICQVFDLDKKWWLNVAYVIADKTPRYWASYDTPDTTGAQYTGSPPFAQLNNYKVVGRLRDYEYFDWVNRMYDVIGGMIYTVTPGPDALLLLSPQYAGIGQVDDVVEG